jgi:hypothetical protein
MQTVMMVEQILLRIPNYVESFLLFCGYPADSVHSAFDKALGLYRDYGRIGLINLAIFILHNNMNITYLDIHIYDLDILEDSSLRTLCHNSYSVS